MPVKTNFRLVRERSSENSYRFPPCYKKELKGAPYVKLNGMVIEQATAEKIFERMKELLDS